MHIGTFARAAHSIALSVKAASSVIPSTTIAAAAVKPSGGVLTTMSLLSGVNDRGRPL